MILLVNPWIYDFATYDMWMMPIGLLHIGALLKRAGFGIQFIDCLESGLRKKTTGDGRINSQNINKPPELKFFPRNYKRYGVFEEILNFELSSMQKQVECILVTSKMTYWYPGVKSTVSVLRKFFPGAKIILGGTYATLLPEHALKNVGVDYVFPGDGLDELNLLLNQIYGKYLGDENKDFYEIALELKKKVNFLPLLTSIGCTFSCSYCASPFLQHGFKKFSPERVVEKIVEWNEKFNCFNVTLFDDAFLVDREHAKSILRLLIDSGKKFMIHAPNALHARFLDEDIAELMKSAGFRTIRIGLESADENFQKESGGKVNNRDFLDAVLCLERAGFSRDEIGAYIMVGLPCQGKEDVVHSVKFVLDCGCIPKVVEYSPIPGTPMFEQAKRFSPFNLNEPLFQNNSLLPCRWEGFTYEDYRFIKEWVRDKLNHKF